MQGSVIHCKELGFVFQEQKKSLEGFQEGDSMTLSRFHKAHVDAYEKNGSQNGSREASQNETQV